MKKTGKLVEADVFSILKGTALKTTISGQMYRGESSRPLNAKTEDAVVSFMAGMDGQTQNGVVTVNVYVPDIDNGDTTPKQDAKRCETIESLMMGIVENINEGSAEYVFELQNMIQTFVVEGTNQSRVNTQIHFTRTTL